MGTENRHQNRLKIRFRKRPLFSSSARGRVRDAHDEVSNNGPFRDYDLVVVTSGGIWEGVRLRDCRMMVNTTQHTTISISDLDIYDLVLDSMANLSSPDLQFAFHPPR